MLSIGLTHCPDVETAVAHTYLLDASSFLISLPHIFVSFFLVSAGEPSAAASAVPSCPAGRRFGIAVPACLVKRSTHYPISFFVELRLGMGNTTPYD